MVRWTHWRQQYGSLTDELRDYVNTYDTLERLPDELSRCWSDMPKPDQDNVLKYVHNQYNPNCYRSCLRPFSEIDQHIVTQTPLVNSLIELNRRTRDSGEYQAVWDFARLETVSSASVNPSIVNCFAQLSVATYRVCPGTFCAFGSHDRKWLDRSKPWLMAAFKEADIKY